MTRYYVDSANIDEIAPLLDTGVFTGVTTNPTLLARAGLAGKDLPALYAAQRSVGSELFFAQVWGSGAVAMLETADFILALGDDVVVKVPATHEGLKVACEVKARGARVLLTAVYAVHQAVTASACELSFVAPYIGKLTDAGLDGPGMAIVMQEALNRGGGKTQVLAASVRSSHDLARMAVGGIEAFTLPVPIAEALLTDEMTERAAREFERVSQDW